MGPYWSLIYVIGNQFPIIWMEFLHSYPTVCWCDDTVWYHVYGVFRLNSLMIISKNYQLHTLFTTRSEALVPVQFLLCIGIRYTYREYLWIQFQAYLLAFLWICRVCCDLSSATSMLFQRLKGSNCDLLDAEMVLWYNGTSTKSTYLCPISVQCFVYCILTWHII